MSKVPKLRQKVTKQKPKMTRLTAKMTAPKPGKVLESFVATLERSLASDPGVKVEAPARLRDRTNNTMREHDVLITHTRSHHVTTTAIECRDRSRPVGAPEIEAFAAKCHDTCVDTAIIVSSKGFADTALVKAKHKNVRCFKLVEGGLLPALAKETMSRWKWKRAPAFTFHAVDGCDPVGEFAIQRQDGSDNDFHPEFIRALKHFDTIPIPDLNQESSDKVGEVWYRALCDDLHVLEVSTGRKIALAYLVVIIDFEWIEERAPLRIMTYSDALLNQPIASIGVAEFEDGSRISFTERIRKRTGEAPF